MNTALVDGIVKAVLYEGYMLYPYRPSAVKNRQRFNFGVVYPRAYSEQQGGTDAWTMQTQCLVRGNAEAHCAVQVRFLRMVDRTVGKVRAPILEVLALKDVELEPVERLEVRGETYQPWQEAVEEDIEVPEVSLATLALQPMQCPFRLSAKQEREPLIEAQGATVGMLLRDKSSIAGTIDVSAENVAPNIYKLTARISNTSRMETCGAIRRDAALARALVSAHTILEVRGGAFVSLVDPPEEYREIASACENIGTWPILVGQEGQNNIMLSSPIILYDYPQIAAESPGDLFDGGEIDEILSLRILTMTEEEKQEMRSSDDRTRKILERTEAMPDEQFSKLHGVLRGLQPAKSDKP
jgi:hypothetical protein